MEFWGLMLLSYLCGSIPSGYLIARFFSKIDIRQHGSGNIGATNVFRNLGKKFALATLICDICKGIIPVFIARMFFADWNIIYLIAGMAVIGHMFPIWLRFKGGKGVATSSAVLVAINPKVGLMVIACWILVFILSRISSLSAIIAAILSPVFAYWFDNSQPNLPLFCFVLSILIIIKHYKNIINLFKGQEKKL